MKAAPAFPAASASASGSPGRCSVAPTARSRRTQRPSRRGRRRGARRRARHTEARGHDDRPDRASAQSDPVRRPGHRALQGRAAARRTARPRVPQGQDRDWSVRSRRSRRRRVMKLDFLPLRRRPGRCRGAGSSGGCAGSTCGRSTMRGRPIRTGLIAAAVFFGLFLLFALLAPISGAAIAEGEVTVTGSRLLVQPEGTGIVSRDPRPRRPARPARPAAGPAERRPLRRPAPPGAGPPRRASCPEARLIAERDGAKQLLFPHRSRHSLRRSDRAPAAMRSQFAICRAPPADPRGRPDDHRRTPRRRRGAAPGHPGSWL